VVATESTVRGGAYQQAIWRCRPAAVVATRACPLFVALAEEGWTEGEVVEAVVHRYLDDLFAAGASERPDTLVLGCTHFPVLATAIRKVLGDGVAIVDSAETTASALVGVLERAGLLRGGRAAPGSLRLLATDSAERFARVGGTFLGRPLAAADVEVVDL